MKYIFILLICSPAQAKEFRFTYTFGRDQLKYKTEADSWEEAFKRGTNFCFDFFVKREVSMTEEKGLDIIDTCANPR